MKALAGPEYLIAAGLLFAATALWLAMLITSMKHSLYRSATILTALLLAGIASEWMLPVSIQGKFFALAACLAVGWKAVLSTEAKKSLSWQGFKYYRDSLKQTTLHMILLSLSFIFTLPFLWLLVTSLKSDSQMSKFPPEWIPTQQVEQKVGGVERKLDHTLYQNTHVEVAVLKEYDNGSRLVQILKPASYSGKIFLTQDASLIKIRHFAPVWANYSGALKFLPSGTEYGLVFLKNTVLITFFSILGTLLSSSMVAFGFARLRWPGRDKVFVVLLATMMLPAAVTMMPVFLIFREMGWIDTLYPLWVPSFFASAFNVFLLRQFFLSIPTELEEAARIDGCSYYTIFWKIMLPQIKPALAALTIMSFMGAWNDFRGPLIYISSPSKETLAYALQLFQSAHGGEPGMMMAASVMVMLPVLILFFFTQRYFIEGITLTGIKG